MKLPSLFCSLLLLLALGLTACGEQSAAENDPNTTEETVSTSDPQTESVTTSPSEEGETNTEETAESDPGTENTENGGSELTESGPELSSAETITDPEEGNTSNSGEAAPVKLDPKEIASEPKLDTGPPNHAPWTALLKKHVTSSGKVKYNGFKSDQAALNAYLETLKAHPPQSDWNRNEKLAYWINVYNAFTVDLVVRNYPVKSITDIGGPWDIRFIDIGGKKYTLSEIENKVIRPRFNEPRIHFAVNCASVSCPKLLNEAYTTGKLNQQLTAQTKSYINNPAENTLSAKSGEISQLFEWYQEDFVKKGTLIEFINKYSTTKLKDNAKITYKQYNWGLNE